MVLPPLTLTGIAVIVLCAALFHWLWTRRITALGPTILTTTGILFCFIGIAWGLVGFDPNDVRSSVPHLLEGIRTSFWSSVAGILCALTLKLRVVMFGDPRLPASGAQQGATVADLAALLLALNKSIAGTEDSTLLSQLKLHRADSNDRLERLQRSFEEFARNVAESNSKALISALSDVIKDFNEKLNEQFGENFKQLNAAVEKLVTWQVQYEQQLNALIEQETRTRANMEAAADRYGQLVSHSGRLVAVAESMGGMMTTLESQKQHMITLLGNLAALVNQASTGLPQIETRILEMTRQIESGVKTNQAALGATLTTAAQAMQAHSQDLTTKLTRTIETADKDLNAHLRQSVDDSKKQILALDAALEAELQKALESLGRQLTALSKKFVEDYTPLTDRLRSVVRIAQGFAA